jgi:hypothetical protein
VLASPAVTATRRRLDAIVIVLALCALPFAAACKNAPNAAFIELGEARRLAADLRVQFNKAADASDRAVMADTDETSVSFAREAERATKVVQDDVAELGPHLASLGRPSETQALDDFSKHLADYLTLDRSVLDLAVENTNLKAQRLSFGPAREAADGFREALQRVAASVSTRDRCRVESLVAKAILAVRDIQVLQAPHIAEANDDAMTRIEAQMGALEAAARDALEGLSGVVEANARPEIATAHASLDRFRDISAQIVALSRRNTNVRSLALSLREKPMLTAACDDSLRQLEEALAKDGFTATR